ncbi:MAG: GNAT family N-acetyltransferase [Proteobacteria bacterium]|nr:GNAT family N-acetyltransferase [Pseudomonadota bacterium]
MRKEVFLSDVASVRSIVRATGFFTEEEIQMAGELVETYLQQGEQSGYRFLFLEEEGRVVGYACFGEISCTNHRYDLYWIAVDPKEQGKGLGRKILEETESEIRSLGGQKVYIETSSRPRYLPTRQFYLARGYVVDAQLKDFYNWGDDKVIFSRTLMEAPRIEEKPVGRTRPTKIRKVAVSSRKGI